MMSPWKNLNNLIGGHIDAGWGNLASLEAYEQAGQIDIVGIIQQQRVETSPHVRTFAEQGITMPANAKWTYPPTFREPDLATAKVVRSSLPKGTYPWSDQPTISITTSCWNPNPHEDKDLDITALNSVTLVPMGTTILRWTAFPPGR